MNSIKTTIVGVLIILGALAIAGRALLDKDPETIVNYELLAGEIVVGLGFFMTRDNTKTSRKALGRSRERSYLP